MIENGKIISENLKTTRLRLDNLLMLLRENDAFSIADVEYASHSGQKIHQKTVDEILKRLKFEEVNLHCGIMTPYSEEENKRLISQGKSPSVFHCSCSGKHSAMLALAKFRGYSVDSYEKTSNPVQQEILKTISLHELLYNDTRKQDRQNGQNKLELRYGEEKEFYTGAESKNRIGGSAGRKDAE